MGFRGALNGRVQEVSKKFFGRKITTVELRLIPYVQYVMCNSQKLEINKISGEERKILSGWRKAGYIEGGASGMGITKEFWDYMCEVLFYSYVDID